MSESSPTTESTAGNLPVNPDEDGAERVQRLLGLRPTSYLETDHPDKRPCPSWCWVGQAQAEGTEEGLSHYHEVEVRDPMNAHHLISMPASVVASLYEGVPRKTPESGTDTARVEVDLSQRGQGEPVIRIALRSEAGHKEKLRLAVADAKELASVLNYMVELAERG